MVITDPAAAAQVLATVPGRTHNYKHIDEVGHALWLGPGAWG